MKDDKEEEEEREKNVHTLLEFQCSNLQQLQIKQI